MTHFIDVSGVKTKKGSPIAAIFVVVYFLILNMIMDPSFMYLFIFLGGSVIINLVFDYSVRVAYYSFKFITTPVKLSPNFKDFRYIRDENEIENLRKVLDKG